LCGFRGDFLREAVHGSGFIQITAKDAGSEVAPAVQAFTVTGNVLRGIVGKGEVREEQPLRMKSGNGIERSVPQFDGDVRRRSGRQNKRMAIDGDPPGIANERDALSNVEVCDVVGSVTGCIEHLNLARPKRDGFAALKRMKVGGGNGQELSEESLHVAAIQARGTLEKFGGINQMGNTAGVDENLEPRIFTDQRPSGSRMIQVDVGEEYGVEVGKGEAVLRKLFRESRKRRGWPGIDQRHIVLRAQEGRGNRVTMAGPKKVDGDRWIHGKKECSATSRRSIAKWTL